VFLAIMGISWFWLYGALFLAQFPAYAKSVLGGGGHGDAAARHLHGGHRLGSLLCEKLSGGQSKSAWCPSARSA
jgi:hypothetical protein